MVAMPGDDREASLDFPDLPRMELETVLEQLTDRAEDVLRAQGRLRGLLRANAAVASELSLPMVLHRIVEVARDLVGARYAALGVIGTDGTLEEFVYAGMDEADADRIGQLPRGAGILGLLINDPEPLRLADLTEHPLAAGFPAGHPAMHAFLGVPIRVGDSVFGRLYLTEKAGGGEFTEEDEQLTISLAGTAGAAISNARMFAESEQRRRWLTASGELTPRLLGDEPVDAFELIARHAAEASEADFAAALIPVGESQLVVRAVVGLLADELADRLVPVEGSFAGEVLRSGKPTLITDYSTDPSAAPLSVVIGPVIVVPLIAGERIRGVLVLGRRGGQKALAALDLDMAASFARQAAVALELVDARVDQLNMARLEDHDRIARDLHDHVIQELFAAGMAIQSLASVIGNKAQVERVLNHVDTLDRVIARIRSTILRAATRPAIDPASGRPAQPDRA
jgi:GAF domain-containing protein